MRKSTVNYLFDRVTIASNRFVKYRGKDNLSDLMNAAVDAYAAEQEYLLTPEDESVPLVVAEDEFPAPRFTSDAGLKMPFGGRDEVHVTDEFY